MALVGCVSQGGAPVTGLQPGYGTATFTRVLFAPGFVVSDPAKVARVDNAAMLGDRVLESVEKAIVAAFRAQPGVPGFSPVAVRSMFSKDPEALTSLSAIFLSAQQKVLGNASDGKGGFSRDCTRSTSVPAFFVRCLQKREDWREATAKFSTVGLNADATLLAVVSSLEKSKTDNKFSLAATVSVLLVDNASGKLVWGREVSDTLESDLIKEGFPEWSVLFARMFSEPFWMEFPGRIQVH